MKRMVIVAAFFTLLVFPYQAQAAVGDVNNDGQITLEDATIAIKTACGMVAGANAASDADGDGMAGLHEAVYVMQYLSGLFPPLDLSPPTVPQNVRAAASGSGRMNVTWDASSDDTGVAGYEIYRDGVMLASPGECSYSDTGLIASTEYCYTVLAYDSAGNKSGLSAQSCAITGEPLVIVDGSGVVQSTVAVAGPDNAVLTLYAGTRIALAGEGDALETPGPADVILLALTAPSTASPALPDGITSLAQVQITLTVNGTDRDAWFWADSTAPSDERGLKLTVIVNDPEVPLGTFGLLFSVSSDTPRTIATSSLRNTGDLVLETSKKLKAAMSKDGDSGSRQMNFDPNQTGPYNAGGAPPGNTSPPEGCFKASYVVTDPGCIDLGTVQICGPYTLASVEIIEESTAQILGECTFANGDMADTGVLPPGYQFWCERGAQAADGGIPVTVYSKQANLPLIKPHLILPDGQSAWWNYHRPTGGLVGPDGQVYSDPYEHREFQFAGFKALFFTTKQNKDYKWAKQHSSSLLANAGYEAYMRRFDSTSPGFIAEVNVSETLDGRKLLEEDVITPDVWDVRKDQQETFGNKGTYDYNPKYKGTITAVMTMPVTGVKVWEITVDATFEKVDSGAYIFDGFDTYASTEGTITQISYTVPDAYGTCYGDPASFTGTYPMGFEDGLIWIKQNTSPAEYMGTGTIDDSTPLVEYNYDECCPYRALLVPPEPVCQPEVLERDEQEHAWLQTGDANWTAQQDGSLQGTYSQPYGATYTWNLTPEDQE